MLIVFIDNDIDDADYKITWISPTTVGGGPSDAEVKVMFMNCGSRPTALQKAIAEKLHVNLINLQSIYVGQLREHVRSTANVWNDAIAPPYKVEFIVLNNLNSAVSIGIVAESFVFGRVGILMKDLSVSAIGNDDVAFEYAGPEYSEMDVLNEIRFAKRFLVKLRKTLRAIEAEEIVGTASNVFDNPRFPSRKSVALERIAVFEANLKTYEARLQKLREPS